MRGAHECLDQKAVILVAVRHPAVVVGGGVTDASTWLWPAASRRPPARSSPPPESSARSASGPRAPRAAASRPKKSRAASGSRRASRPLAELSFGDWEGRRWEELERDDAAALRGWMERWTELAPPGGETVAELEGRVRSWLAELPARGDELLVAHAGVMRALAVVLDGASWPEAMAQTVPHLAARRFIRAG